MNATGQDPYAELVATAQRAQAAAAPRARLAELTRLIKAATELQVAAVAECRAAGDSWAKVADALQVERQTAHERFAPKKKPKPDPAPASTPTRRRRPRQRQYDVTLLGGLRIASVTERSD